MEVIIGISPAPSDHESKLKKKGSIPLPRVGSIPWEPFLFTYVSILPFYDISTIMLSNEHLIDDEKKRQIFKNK